jgi:esterase/lipase
MKKKHSGGIFALIFGTIIGAITAIFLSTDKQGNTKKGVKKTVGDTKKKIEELDKKEVLKAVETRINKASAEFKKAKESLSKKIDAAKEKLDQIDKTKYQSLVNEVIAELKKAGKATSTQLKDIKTLLVEDYHKVAPKKPAKKAKKVAKK